MLNYCLWSLSSISDGDICQIQEVLNLNCTKKILEMIDQDDMEITSSCLKIIGNLLTGCDKQNQILLEEGIIGALAPLLEHQNKIIRRDTVWAFSNILAGNHIQIDLVFKYNDGEIIEKLFNMIEVDDIGVTFLYKIIY